MSTVKVNEVRHLSNSGTANIVLESNATTNLQATSTLGLSVIGTLTVSGVSTFNGNIVIGNATTDTVDLQSKVTGFNNFSGFTGEIRMYAGNEGPDAPPTGWLYCNGDTISSITANGGTHYNLDGKGNDYQNLFNLLKTNSNWGNSGSPSWGTNTVKLPDFRSRSPVGVHTGAANSIPTGLTSRTIGIGTSIADGSTLVGAETHTLTTAQSAAHTHTLTPVASATGQSISTITANQSTHHHSSAGHYHAVDPPNTTTTTHSGHAHSLQSSVSSWAGGGSYASTGTHIGNAQSTPNSGTAGSHSHDLNIGSFNSGTTTPGNTGDTDPAITVSGGALGGETHTHSSTIVSTGGGNAHPILSPIIAVNYIIKV
jgi:microcystin-dependent protein